MKLSALFLALLCFACNGDGQSDPADQPKPELVRRALHQSCGKPTDCVTGLTCVELRCIDPRMQKQKECERSQACVVSGACGFHEGRCAARTNAHCQSATNCAESGACALNNSGCSATRPSHCALSNICKTRAQCALRLNQCVWRPEPGQLLPVVARDKGSTLYVFKTEVTQRQFLELSGKNPSFHKDCGGACPVERVSMTSAFQYADECSKRSGLTPCYGAAKSSLNACDGFRLPTESEWQWLAFDAPHGHTVSVPWSKENSGFESHPVCTSGVQRFGLCDVLGNVWEWVHADDDLRRDVLMIEGKASVRGGSFAFRKDSLNPPSRWREDSTQGGMTVGFRLLTTTALD